jgi:hypothetical protein
MELKVEVNLSAKQILKAYNELDFWGRQEVYLEIFSDPPMSFKCDECSRTELCEDGKTCLACRDFHCAGIPRPPLPIDKIAILKEVKRRTGASLKMVKHRLEICEWDVEKVCRDLKSNGG